MCFWPPMSHTLSLKPLCCTDLMLNPCVGVMCDTSSCERHREGAQQRCGQAGRASEWEGTNTGKAGVYTHGAERSVTKRVAAHPGELLERSRLAGVVESEHQDAELFAVLLEVPEEREEPLRTTWATGLGECARRGATPEEGHGTRTIAAAERPSAEVDKQPTTENFPR